MRAVIVESAGPSYWRHPAQAQITYEGGGNGSLSDVCGGSTGTLLIATNDGCGNGTDFNALPTAVIIGSAAAGAAFQMSDGAAQFNGASTTFQNIVTMNGGITVTGGTISMGNNRVQNVATPTADTDAANKGYVDQQNAAQQTQIDFEHDPHNRRETVNANQQTQINSNTTRITNVEPSTQINRSRSIRTRRRTTRRQ